MSEKMPMASEFTAAKEEYARALDALEHYGRRARAACLRLATLHERQAIAADGDAHRKYAEGLAAHYFEEYRRLGGK